VDELDEDVEALAVEEVLANDEVLDMDEVVIAGRVEA
jgi:hypothetical protein